MLLLHADRLDPRSIDGIIKDSIASQLQLINSDVVGVESMLALIGVRYGFTGGGRAGFSSAAESSDGVVEHDLGG